MTAIQFRPQHFQVAPITEPLLRDTNKPIHHKPFPVADRVILSGPGKLTQDTVNLTRFGGSVAHRVSDDSAIVADVMNLQHAEPPEEFHEKVDPVKLKIAEELRDWMAETLNQKKAVAAVVSRNGSEQAQQYDPTGMAHSGLALFDPDRKKWVIYNLLNDVPGTSAPARMLDYMAPMWEAGAYGASRRMAETVKNTTPGQASSAAWDFCASFSPGQAWGTWREIMRKTNPRAQVWRSNPLEFFYDQPVTKKDALIMIPSEDIQKRLRDGVLSGRYKKLYFTNNYNLVSDPHSKTSLNCNKWVLMNILAAQQDDYTHTKILESIKQCFKPGEILMNPLLRPLAKYHPTILSEEVPVYGPIRTITVESLYRSELFPHKEFFIPREVKSKT